VAPPKKQAGWEPWLCLSLAGSSERGVCWSEEAQNPFQVPSPRVPLGEPASRSAPSYWGLGFHPQHHHIHSYPSRDRSSGIFWLLGAVFPDVGGGWNAAMSSSAGTMLDPWRCPGSMCPCSPWLGSPHQGLLLAVSWKYLAVEMSSGCFRSCAEQVLL
jgi:hypothetical protein